MAFISVTRLRLRKRRYLLPFFWYNEPATRQIARAPGFRDGVLFIDAQRTFWTITLWESPEAMAAYRSSGAHRKAMGKLQHWCDEASVVHWTEEPGALPKPPEAHARMLAEGRASKVQHPSADHAAWNIAPPRWPSHMMRPLKPKASN